MEAAQCLGKGYHVRQRPDSQSHTYIHIPTHSSSVTGTEDRAGFIKWIDKT